MNIECVDHAYDNQLHCHSVYILVLFSVATMSFMSVVTLAFIYSHCRANQQFWTELKLVALHPCPKLSLCAAAATQC